MIITLDAPPVHGRAIFCDDIRMEIDQKITYVGVYNGTMLVNGSFPVKLPKFGISILFHQDRDIFVPNIGLRVFLPEDPEDKASIEADAEAPEDFNSSEVPEEMPIITIGANMMFAPFVIKSPGLIKVRALRKGEFHRLGSLRVIAGSQPA